PAPPSSLHSFPTRRSSDLLQVDDRSVEPQLAFRDACRIEQLVDEPPLHPRATLESRERAVATFVVESACAELRNPPDHGVQRRRSEEHTSELQSLAYLVCR